MDMCECLLYHNHQGTRDGEEEKSVNDVGFQDNHNNKNYSYEDYVPKWYNLNCLNIHISLAKD